MARKRMIDPGMYRDEKIGALTCEERFLFIGLLSFAEDTGVGRANPLLIKCDIFPYDDVSQSAIAEMLTKLNDLGLIRLYEVDKQKYYFVTNFKKHQTINKPSRSTLPLLTDEEKGESSTTTPLPEHYGSTTTPLPSQKEKEEEKENKKEIETEDEDNTRDSSSQVIDTFTKEIHPPSPIEMEKLMDWCNDMSEEVVVLAIEQAAMQNKRSMSYINGILNAWHKDNVKTKEAALERIRQFQDSHNRGKPPDKSTAKWTTAHYAGQREDIFNDKDVFLDVEAL